MTYCSLCDRTEPEAVLRVHEIHLFGSPSDEVMALTTREEKIPLGPNLVLLKLEFFLLGTGEPRTE